MVAGIKDISNYLTITSSHSFFTSLKLRSFTRFTKSYTEKQTELAHGLHFGYLYGLWIVLYKVIQSNVPDILDSRVQSGSQKAQKLERFFKDN